VALTKPAPRAAERVLANAGADVLARLTASDLARLVLTTERHMSRRPDEPADRLAHRLRSAVNCLERSGGPERIRNMAPWLAAVITRRRGCAREDCEDGLLWWDRLSCPACTERRAQRRRARQPTGTNPARPDPRPVSTPLACCDTCERPFPRGTGPGTCRACRTTTASAIPAS
jgi:hypothetical protein